MALANPVELFSQRELGKSIEEFVPLDPGRSRAWTASLWDFLYDRTLQERCGGVASGRGFEADECRQDHRPVSCKGGGRMEPPLYSKCEDCREDNPAKQELKRALLN